MDKIEINIETLRETLNTKLAESGWDKMLSPYTNGLSFDHIMNTLVDNVNQDKRFTPRFKDVFNAFYECPYDKVKVVIVGQDPYPQLGVADGIAFSCSRKGKTEKSLQYIFKALYGEYEGHDNDLRRWSNQGVLMINTAFTCEINNSLILLAFCICTKNNQSNKHARFLGLMAGCTVVNPQSYPQLLWICFCTKMSPLQFSNHKI